MHDSTAESAEVARRCPVCGSPVPPDPRRRYCGSACRQRDFYHRSRRHLRLYADHRVSAPPGETERAAS